MFVPEAYNVNIPCKVHVIGNFLVPHYLDLWHVLFNILEDVLLVLKQRSHQLDSGGFSCVLHPGTKKGWRLVQVCIHNLERKGLYMTQ